MEHAGKKTGGTIVYVSTVKRVRAEIITRQSLECIDCDECVCIILWSRDVRP